LFHGCYKAIPAAKDPREGGLECFRDVSTYIHLNPFRAKLCGEGLKLLRIRMGHPSTASLAINRFAQNNSLAATRLRKKLVAALAHNEKH